MFKFTDFNVSQETNVPYWDPKKTNTLLEHLTQDKPVGFFLKLDKNNFSSQLKKKKRGVTGIQSWITSDSEAKLLSSIP